MGLSMRTLGKNAPVIQGLPKSARRRQCFENAPGSRAHEYVIFLRARSSKENKDNRERRRRERRKFWGSLCDAFSAKSARNRQRFENAPGSRAHEYVIFARVRSAKENKDSRERRRRERRKFGDFGSNVTTKLKKFNLFYLRFSES